MSEETSTVTKSKVLQSSIKAPPIDEQIEQLVRTQKTISVTRAGNGNQHVHAQLIDGESFLPESTKKRFALDKVDLSHGYPALANRATVPIYVDEAKAIRDHDIPYDERAKHADPKKRALFGAAKEVKNLTAHIGTEIVGLQLADLTDKQKDELALLIAERGVVFFRNQKLPVSAQRKLGEYYASAVEVHPQAAHVPGFPGVTTIWNNWANKVVKDVNFKNVNNGDFDSVRYGDFSTQVWHSDLVHEHQSAGYTHLHLDAIPKVGGDTLWASGYGAYDKLSEEFKNFLDGKKAVYVSANGYLDRKDPFGGPKRIERVHPLVRTNPATGWKSLFVNRAMTKRIIGVTPVESDLILNYLFDIYEKNADIQVRFNWKSDPGYGTSAIWDNRVTQHRNIWDQEDAEERHGTRVTALAEVPYFDPKSKSQREALGLPITKED